jgi:hypothetical protein
MSELNLNLSESIIELGKLIQLMDEDAENLGTSQAINDYIVPILESVVAEVEANRQYILQTADRTNLAYLMNDKTFTGEILTSIADHFATVLEELPQDTDPDSKLGVALAEIQDLLATWMSFDISEEDVNAESEDEAFEESEDEALEESEDEDIEVVQGEIVLESEDV